MKSSIRIVVKQGSYEALEVAIAHIRQHFEVTQEHYDRAHRQFILTAEVEYTDSDFDRREIDTLIYVACGKDGMKRVNKHKKRFLELVEKGLLEIVRESGAYKTYRLTAQGAELVLNLPEYYIDQSFLFPRAVDLEKAKANLAPFQQPNGQDLS